MAIQRYRARLSGPLLDRIDLPVEAPSLTIEELRQAQPAEIPAAIRPRIEATRTRQRVRRSDADTPYGRRPASPNCGKIIPQQGYDRRQTVALDPDFPKLSCRAADAWDERRRVTAVIVEDQIMFRGFLRKICEDALGIAVVAEVTGAAEALTACQQHHPRILLLDLELPDGNGLDIAPELKRTSPETRILAISAKVDDYTLYRVVDSGVDGYIDKVGSSVDSLTDAIRAVATRGSYFSPAVDTALRKMADDPVAFPKILSPRELDVLRLIGGGCSDQDAARRLRLSAQTVKTHRRNIMLKLGLHSSRELMRYAATAGFARF